MNEYKELEGKLMTKTEFIIQLLNGLTEQIVRTELDIDVLQSDIFEESHANQSKEIAELNAKIRGRKKDLARYQKVKRIAEQLLVQYQKDEPDKKN